MPVCTYRVRLLEQGAAQASKDDDKVKKADKKEDAAKDSDKSKAEVKKEEMPIVPSCQTEPKKDA